MPINRRSQSRRAFVEKQSGDSYRTGFEKSMRQSTMSKELAAKITTKRRKAKQR